MSEEPNGTKPNQDQATERTPLDAAADVIRDGFRSASSAGKSVTNLSLGELDVHDQYLRKLEAAKSSRKGIGKFHLGGGSPRG